MATKKNASPALEGDPAGMKFEQALDRLEKIVDEMESGSLPLDDLISRFEEGQKLVKHCLAKLDEVERKIEILVKEGEKFRTKPFEAAAEEEKEKDVE